MFKLLPAGVGWQFRLSFTREPGKVPMSANPRQEEEQEVGLEREEVRTWPGPNATWQSGDFQVWSLPGRGQQSWVWDSMA